MMGHRQAKVAGRDGAISCDQARELFYDLADVELSDEDRSALALHELSCSNCGDEFKEWRRLRIALQDSMVAPAIDFKAGVMGRIQSIQAEPKATRSISWAALWQQNWTKGVAAAAIVFALMAGAAKLPVVAGLGGLLGNSKPRVAVQTTIPPIVKPQDRETTPISPSGGAPGNGSPVSPVKPGNPGGGNQAQPPATPVTPSNHPQVAVNNQPDGQKWLANQKRMTISTTLKITVDNIDQAHNDALSIAKDLNAALSSATPTQNNGHPTMLLRFAVAPGQAGAFLDQLAKLGSVAIKNTESKDITNQFASTLEAYQSLKAQQEAAPDANKQQYDSQISALELNLKNWADASGKQVVLLWLEQ